MWLPFISTVSLEYLRASQRWIRDGGNGKKKALQKDVVTKGKIKPLFHITFGSPSHLAGWQARLPHTLKMVKQWTLVCLKGYSKILTEKAVVPRLTRDVGASLVGSRISLQHPSDVRGLLCNKSLKNKQKTNNVYFASLQERSTQPYHTANNGEYHSYPLWQIWCQNDRLH